MHFEQSPFIVAINKSKVLNTEESFQLMQAAGPRVCILTASHPGFLGFQTQVQTGAMPLAGRYGGAQLNMGRHLNPVRNYQYTVWKNVEDHQDFHEKNFSRLFELCSACFAALVEGPTEPIFSVVSASLPAIGSSFLMPDVAVEGRGRELSRRERVVGIEEQMVKVGQEQAFELGITALLDALSDSAGFLGYMVLRQIGISAWGSFVLDPESMFEMLETLGAHPPGNPRAAFAVGEAIRRPVEYVIHTEWETPELLQLGFGKMLVNRRIRTLASERVLPHVMRWPSVWLFEPMLEEPSWRRSLSG